MFLGGVGSHGVNPSLNPKLPYDAVKDFSPISLIGAAPLLLAVHPSVQAKTVKELIQLAKAKAGQLNFASNGKGSSSHLAAEMFMMMTETNMVHVPYKGLAPALTDLLSGQVNILFDLYNTSLPQIRAGKIRPVALTRPTRGAPLPEVPVMAETLPGFILVGWHGVMLPPGVPRPIVDKLNLAFAEALADKDVTKRVTDGFSEIAHTSPEAFGEILREDFAKYARIVKDAGIKPE